MYEGIEQYLIHQHQDREKRGCSRWPYPISADDDSDVLQYFVPYPLVSPAVHSIGSRYEPALN